MIPDYLKKSNNEIVAINNKPFLIKVEFLPFQEWPASVKYKLATELEKDLNAMMAISDVLEITDKDEQVEKYAYCKNGGFDNKADFDADGNHNVEYFDCPLRESCPAKAQKHLCGTIKAKNGYLFPAEINVIKLIAQDLSDKEIADQLNVSYNTASKHRYNIIRKIEAAGKPGIVKFAFDNGII